MLNYLIHLIVLHENLRINTTDMKVRKHLGTQRFSR